MSKIRIAINGFGRIGRTFFRAAFGDPAFEFVAINDLADTKTLAYLLTYDSVYGRYGKPVEARENALVVDGKEINIFCQKDNKLLPWKDLAIDIVVEATGLFASSEKSRPHLDAGARRVVISAPATGDATMALIGVNDDRFAAAGPITCNASCTTNSVAPVLAILDEAFGIKKASMVTVHAYTATQKLVDSPDVKDMRRGRSAAINIVPSTTGAAEAVIQILPGLAGKFDATAIRIPVVVGSLSIISAFLSRGISADEVNEALGKAAAIPRWSKIVKVTSDPLVSSDIIGEPYGAIIDLSLTKLIDHDFVLVYSWYDNEAGYAAMLKEHVKRVAENL